MQVTAGFGLLQLGHVDFDDIEAAVAQRVGGARVAGRQDQPVAGADGSWRRRLGFVDRERLDTGELRRIDPSPD